MKTKHFLIVSCTTVLFAINACSKERINDCLNGNEAACEILVPTENTVLDDGHMEMDATLIESDSTLAVSKLPVRD